MSQLVQDLKFGVRTLLSKPGFTIIAALTLALGIGVNTAIFSVVKAVLLAPLPYAQPDGIAMIWTSWSNEDKGWVGPAEYADFLDQLTSIQSLAVWATGTVNLTGDGDPVRLAGATVSANTFDVLGVFPVLGRTFTAEDDLSGQINTVILSDELWRGRFAADSQIIGRQIILDGEAMTVLGVMPAGFRLPTEYGITSPAKLWSPLGLDPTIVDRSYRGNHGLYCAGRLNHTRNVADLNAELTALFSSWTHEENLYPPDAQMTAFAVSVNQEIMGDVRPSMLMLMGAAGLLLLIACVNVTNLLLVRGDDRCREFAIRRALGGGHIRLIRQLITENLLLALIGGIASMLMAAFAIDALMALRPEALPRVTEARIDLSVFFFTMLVSVLTGVVFGSIAALRSVAGDLIPMLKDGARGSGIRIGRQRFQGGLVIVQLALAVLLLSGAGLMVRSFRAMTSVDPGFAATDLLTFQINLPSDGYGTVEERVQFFELAVVELGTIPGAMDVGAVSRLPLDGELGDWDFEIEGRVLEPGKHPTGDWIIATPGYFEAMSMRLVQGRLFTTDDHADAEPVAVLSDSLARRYWPDENPVGLRIRMLGPSSNPIWVSIVGIVEDVFQDSLDQTVKPTYYRPHAQLANSTGFTSSNMSFVIRANGDPHDLAALARVKLASIDPNLPLAKVQTMQRIVSDSVAGPRFTSALLGVFAMVALALASIGIFGVMSFGVTQRAQEIGIRMALGAQRSDVLAHFMKQGFILTVIGVTIGLIAAYGLSGLLSSQLYQVAPSDPVTFIVVATVLMVVAMFACYLPARRATKIDPMTALRCE